VSVNWREGHLDAPQFPKQQILSPSGEDEKNPAEELNGLSWKRFSRTGRVYFLNKKTGGAVV
jgi:hypothetical protein